MNIAHSRPFVGQEEIAAVRRVVASRQLAQGPRVERLEQQLSQSVGHRYGVAVSSGTAALYGALRGLGVASGSEVVIPSYVCTALLNAVLMAGARPVLADVDPATGNCSPSTVRPCLTRKTGAVIVPHMFGCPADAVAIEQLGVPVIEDCAQCVGATINKKKIGSLSTVSIFSFYATKLIAGGEGGMVATSDRRLRDRIIGLREYDKRDRFVPAFNFKLSDVHAALAAVQLARLPEMLQRRRAIARAYMAYFCVQSGALQLPPQEQAVYYRFVVRLPFETVPVIRRLRKDGIECGKPVYKPLHRILKKKGFPGTEQLQKTSLSLPIHPGLSKREVAFVARKVLQYSRGA
ncbi:MAG: DegT/DnrJ/EryC1/StrS family aminotransferase [Chitinispirillaceae bacterium]|nr:DegT/DnrJ/EryC1/StrS family aminotransferase [Chitinispirillaceae bacterium]